jgi:uncharacterized integral membrane protein
MTFWKRPKFILWTLALILLVTVILQNAEPTALKFLFWSVPSIPKLALILISMAVGGVLALLARWEFRSSGKAKDAEVEEHSAPPTLH